MRGAGPAIVVLLAACGARSTALPDAAAVDGGSPPRCLDPSEEPPTGPIGVSCETDDDCADELFCLTMGGLWEPFCSARCDPDVPDGCPPGGFCADGFADGGRCVDACVVSAANPALGSSCGCGSGERCDLLCQPGCQSDADCCAIGLLSPADAKGRTCSQRCRPESSRCDHDGRPGSRIGGPCLLDEECPAHADCGWFAWTSPADGVRHPTGGYCTGLCNFPPGFPDACAGAEDSVCVPFLPEAGPPGSCFESCTPGGDPCARADFVCYPLEAGGGYCFPSCQAYGGDAFCNIEGRGGTCEASGLCSGA